MKRNLIMAVILAAGVSLSGFAQTTPSQTTPSGNKREMKKEKKDSTSTGTGYPSQKKDTTQNKRK